MDYIRNEKYFKEINLKWPIILIIIGVITIAAVIGIVFIAVGILWIVLQVKGRPTDQEIDAAAENQLKDMKSRAIKKLGLDETEVNEIAPISFSGYKYSGNGLQWQVGKDGRFRTNRYEAVMFLFSENEVHCYSYEFSLTDSSSQRESTDVYFYQDIVSVSTQTDGTQASVGNGKSSKFDYEYFKLTTTGGTSITASVLNVDDAQRSINGMRSLLKAKKQRN